MRDLQSKLAREVNRLTGWRGPVFERRYEMTVVTGEEAAQVARLKYVRNTSLFPVWRRSLSGCRLLAGAP